MYFEKQLYKLLNEQSVKFKDKDGKDHEIDMDTAKQYKQDIDGGDKSDYKRLAVKAAGLDKDDSQGDGGKEAPKKVSKIDTNPFDDKPADDKPAGDEPADKPSDKGTDNLKGVPSKFPEFELAEEPFDHDDYDEDMENEISDEVVSYFVDNADKEAMKDYTPEEMQDFVQAQSEKLVAKYQQPDGVPNEKRSMLAYRNDLIDNVRFELGYEDGEAGFDADEIGSGDGDDKSKMIAKHGTNLPSGTDSNTKVSDLDEDAIEEFFEDVADEYSEEYDITPGVMADNSTYIIRQAREDGETLGDLIDSIESAAQEFAEEEGYYGYDENVKSKNQPLRENYNRLFKGRDIL